MRRLLKFLWRPAVSLWGTVVVEVFGTLLGAWLVCNFVRWMNQRNVAGAP